MKSENIKACTDCKYFVDEIGKNKRCKLLDREIENPKVICPNFQKAKDEDETKNTEMHHKNEDFKIANDNDLKSTLSNITLLISLFGCTVLFLILFFLGVALPVFSLGISSAWYGVFAIGVSAAVFALMTVSYRLIGKYVVIRFIYLIVPLVVLLIIIFNYDVFWFKISEFFIDTF